MKQRTPLMPLQKSGRKVQVLTQCQNIIYYLEKETSIKNNFRNGNFDKKNLEKEIRQSIISLPNLTYSNSQVSKQF